ESAYQAKVEVGARTRSCRVVEKSSNKFNVRENVETGVGVDESVKRGVSLNADMEVADDVQTVSCISRKYNTPTQICAISSIEDLDFDLIQEGSLKISVDVVKSNDGEEEILNRYNSEGEENFNWYTTKDENDHYRICSDINFGKNIKCGMSWENMDKILRGSGQCMKMISVSSRLFSKLSQARKYATMLMNHENSTDFDPSNFQDYMKNWSINLSVHGYNKVKKGYQTPPI
ncbi:hypothetical protein HAX54_049929, partial [Datura stramonium]|nr:hypothetical protein [Datura stramonium]